jgi:hypothetical protein
MSIEQLNELLSILENVTAEGKTQFKNLLLKLKPILEAAPSSEIKFKNGKSIFRMCNKEFESLLKNLKSVKTA